MPEDLIENPDGGSLARLPGDDVLSDVLRTVRLTGALQFCLMPSGVWQTDGKPRMANLAKGPATTIPFHILVEGRCWLKMEGQAWDLAAGDIVAFPFATGHQLGAGADGELILPTEDLPPKPWREIPVLRYGDGSETVRLLCGYLRCDAINFRPLRRALPLLLHARTGGGDQSYWLRATISQIAAEVDRPRTGSLSVLERLTEILLIELLRHHIGSAPEGSTGWLAALSDTALSRCLSVIHEDPRREWSGPDLAEAGGLSRSALAERFENVLGTSPMRYVREWRLYLASAALATTTRPIASIADEAGYGTEAAFNRAFSRVYGVPPAAWRQGAARQAA